MSFWKAVVILALLAGLWLRFADLGLKPLHHDEGVNSYFLLNLADHNDYKYNPENYHGFSELKRFLVSVSSKKRNSIAA
jgi:predicted membrane-bound mannosyltransferase